MALKDKLRRFYQVVSLLIIEGLLLFFSAGSWQWIWAWIYIFLQLIMIVSNGLLLQGDLIEERGRKSKNVKKWDKLLNSINAIPTLLMYVICGLDFRFAWTGNILIIFHISGLLIIVAGSLVFTFSMKANRYFSTLVKIEPEKGHYVAQSGPYKVIRHPGYMGYIFMTIGTPVALGTLWGLIPAIITAIIFIIRTAFEDKTLIKELPRYYEYTQKVKYRLLPFLW